MNIFDEPFNSDAPCCAILLCYTMAVSGFFYNSVFIIFRGIILYGMLIGQLPFR